MHEKQNAAWLIQLVGKCALKGLVKKYGGGGGVGRGILKFGW